MKMLRDLSLGTLLAAVLAAALLFLFLAPAFATGSHPAPTPSPQPPAHLSNTVSQVSATKSSANSRSKSQAKSSADSQSQATSGSSSNASGGKAQQSLTNKTSATGGQASAASVTGDSTSTAVAAPIVTTSAGNGDQATEVVVHGDETTYEAPRIPVATAASGGTNTTAACRYSVGAGGQATFLGLSFGIGRKDRDCERIALADMMYDRGNPDAGDVIMCRVKELREAFGDDCLTMLRRSRTPAVSGPTSHQLEQREAFERGEHLK